MENKKEKSFIENASEWPLVYWALPVFLIAFFMFFVAPVFLNTDRTMKFFTYVPARPLIGQDLNYLLSYSKAWFIDGTTPYFGHNLYPPFAMLFFSLLLYVQPYTAFIIVTFFIILGYIFLTFIIPMTFANKVEPLPLAILFLTTGLLSYGLHFELEKGQFNIIAVSFAMAGVYLYHYRPTWRILAYIFFVISVQLKVYPAIFILLFVHDWRDWKGNILRFAGLFAANFALFFIFGYQTFLDFIQAIHLQAAYPYIVMNNLSTRAFTELLFRRNGYRNYFIDHGISLERLLAYSKYARILELGFLALITLCILLALLRAYKRNNAGVDANLLVICTIGALLIPSVSHDYKLSLMAGPVLLALQDSQPKRSWFAWLNLILTLIILFFYTTTLFSPTMKPFLLWNNFPALVIIMLAFTIKSFLPARVPESQ